MSESYRKSNFNSKLKKKKNFLRSPSVHQWDELNWKKQSPCSTEAKRCEDIERGTETPGHKRVHTFKMATSLGRCQRPITSKVLLNSQIL